MTQLITDFNLKTKSLKKKKKKSSSFTDPAVLDVLIPFLFSILHTEIRTV